MKQINLYTLAGLLLAISGLPAFAAGNNIEYLALGDSVAFGYDANVNPFIEDNFAGYPEVVSVKAGPQFSSLANLACPGESSGSFLNVAVADNNCQNWKLAGLPLHTPYTNPLGAQIDEAILQLRSQPSIKLVTLTIGGNDLILLQQGCLGEPRCILQKLPATLVNYGKNLSKILTRIRLEGRYRGRIVLVTYFSPDYRNPIVSGGIGALNVVMLQIGALFGAQTADGFAPFAIASAPFGGDTCAAGLVLTLPTGACDVHPTPKGDNLLADAVLRQLPR